MLLLLRSRVLPCTATRVQLTEVGTQLNPPGVVIVPKRGTVTKRLWLLEFPPPPPLLENSAVMVYSAPSKLVDVAVSAGVVTA